MKAGIIAAGDGSRFQAAGIKTPKPLIQVGGMTLMERTLGILVDNGIDEVAVIVNESMADVATYLRKIELPIPLRTVVKTTESSMHSMYELMPLLQDDRFIACTVDSIMRPEEAAGFIRAFADRPELELQLSYTDFIDDEKPLYIGVDDSQQVLSLGDEARTSPFVTVGLYGLSPSVLPWLEQAVGQGMKKLRNFLGFVIKGGALVGGYRLSKAIDVDRPEDIEVAETFIAEQNVKSCD